MTGFTKKFLLIFSVIFFGTASFAFSASTITWIAASAGNWSNGANWSGGVAPGASDFAIFSASSTQNATINTSVSVAGITITSGYTGTITQGAGESLTVGTTGFSQAAGTFTGDSSGAKITDNGPFNLTNGTFTSTSGDLLLAATSTFLSSFQNNSGTVTLTATSTAFTVSSTFYNLEFYGYYDGTNNPGSTQTVTIATGTTLTVENDLMMSAYYNAIPFLGGGQIDVQGNIDGGDNATGATSTATLALTGTGTQTIDAPNGYSGIHGTSLVIPSFSIQKPSGSVVLENQFSVYGNWSDPSDASIIPGTSTVTFIGSTPTFTVSSTFYNLEFYGYYDGTNNPGSTQTVTIATGTTLTVENDLMMSAYYNAIPFLGGGQIDVQGNIDGGDNATGATSTATLALTGTGTQTIDAPNGYSGIHGTSLVIPSFSIQKPSGSVVLENQFSVYGNWSDPSDASIIPGTSTVTFIGSTPTFTVSSTFYNLEFYGYYDGTNNPGSTQTVTIATGTTLTVENDLMMSAYYNAIPFLGGGQIDVQGNIDGGDNATGATSTATLALTGTGTQTIDAPNGYSGIHGTSLVIPSFSIQKPSGSVVLENQFSVYGNWSDPSDASIIPGTSTVTFIGSTPTFTVSSTFYNLEFYGYYDGVGGGTNQTVTIATGTTLTVENDLMLAANYNFTRFLGGGQIDVQGNIDGGIRAVAATSTATVALTGTGTQIIDTPNSYDASGYSQLILPNLSINKPTGVAYVENTPIINGNLSVLQGELQLATTTSSTTVQINGATTISNGAILSDYPVALSTIKLGSGLTNNGLVFLDGNTSVCTSTPPSNVVIDSTTTNKQVPWSGSGNFIIRYTQVADQGGTASITVWNGVKLGSDVGSNWTFSSGEPTPELVQSTASSEAGTAQLPLPAFGFKPRAGDLVLVAVSAKNQTISAPTDNASNTYTLVASSPFGSSPSYVLSLYYAKNINTTSSFIVTANGNGGTSPFLSASAFEYTGMAASSAYDSYSANTDISGSAVLLTSLGATGQSSGELYFGAMTLAASTTASPESGWTPELGTTNNNTTQALYTEDTASISPVTAAATWASATSTDYAAIMGIFKSPALLNYAVQGTLDSATFDTGVPQGVQLNSFVWQGSEPSNSAAKFQFAVSNSSSGPWNFEGPDGTINTYFSGNPGTPINLVGTNNGYALFNGYRYFRYRVTLFSDPSRVYSPVVSRVSVNWSP